MLQGGAQMRIVFLALLTIIAIFILVSGPYFLNQHHVISFKESPIPATPIAVTPIAVTPIAVTAIPHQHVYYLKVHKTGGTTIHNILAEYCRAHDLIPLLPRELHFNQGGILKPDQLLLIKGVKKYDIVFSHHIYTPTILPYLYDDSFKVASLREPYDNFVSGYLYFKNKWHTGYLERVPTNDQLTEFLRHHSKYEIKGYGSMTNNRQIMDMGYNLTKGFKNIEYIKQFVKEMDSLYDLVIINEYFDEGLVVMKRALHWKTEDIIYYPKNAGIWYKKVKTDKPALEIERRRLHALFSQADIMLYDHFLNRFKKVMEKAVGLEEEVAEFHAILIKVRDYCDSSNTSNSLVFPAGKWTNGFQLTRIKCSVLNIDYYPMTRFMQRRQKEYFKN